AEDCPALRNPLPPGHRKKYTSKTTDSCVLHANEQKRSIFASPPCHGPCGGSDVTDGALLRGPPREPVSDAATEIVCSRRVVDRTARPERGRRNRRDWGHCYGGLAGVRRAIFGRIITARRDHRPSVTSERLCSRLSLFPEIKRESPQQVYHSQCYILTRNKC